MCPVSVWSNFDCIRCFISQRRSTYYSYSKENNKILNFFSLKLVAVLFRSFQSSSHRENVLLKSFSCVNSNQFNVFCLCILKEEKKNWNQNKVAVVYWVMITIAFRWWIWIRFNNRVFFFSARICSSQHWGWRHRFFTADQTRSRPRRKCFLAHENVTNSKKIN